MDCCPLPWRSDLVVVRIVHHAEIRAPLSKAERQEIEKLQDARQRGKDEPLETAILEQYRALGVVKVEVNGPNMAVHVTPTTYRVLLSDRVAANKVMRDWQTRVAQNYGTPGMGSVALYSGGYQVAEAEYDLWAGQIKVIWADQQ